jgi:hypothetical protein
MNSPKLSTPTTRLSSRSLTAKQLQLLTILYKFRYATAELIAKSQNAKHKRVILARLKILVDHGYIGMNYDKTYKLRGKPANYYLLPDGIQILRQQPFASEKVLKRLYYDKHQNEVHITHRLNVFKAYIYLKQKYPNQFQFYAKTELSTWKRIHIPKDLTDGYLKANGGGGTDYFVSYYEASSKTWRIKNSINRYIAYAESNHWQAATKQDFPTVLLICEHKALHRRIDYLVRQATENTWSTITFRCITI